MRTAIAIILFVAASICAPAASAQEAVPKQRPRTRPPSALTGWADWEKGDALFGRITVPPVPVQPRSR